MNEIRLTQLLNLARCIPRESLILSEEILRIERAPEDVLARLESNIKAHVSFGRIAEELRGHAEAFKESVLVIRSAILTRLRYAVHSPKAVCTLPEFYIPGMEDTLTESVRLIRSAEFSISLMNYWMTKGSETLVRALMETIRAKPTLRVVIVGDSKEKFLNPFQRMWHPEIPRPAIYIYKPGMVPDSEDRSKMHAKTLVIDETKMLITSANMTKLAMSENIEVGISIEAPKAVRKISQMINHLIHRSDLFERA